MFGLPLFDWALFSRFTWFLKHGDIIRIARLYETFLYRNLLIGWSYIELLLLLRSTIFFVGMRKRSVFLSTFTAWAGDLRKKLSFTLCFSVRSWQKEKKVLISWIPDRSLRYKICDYCVVYIGLWLICYC